MARLFTGISPLQIADYAKLTGCHRTLLGHRADRTLGRQPVDASWVRSDAFNIGTDATMRAVAFLTLFRAHDLRLTESLHDRKAPAVQSSIGPSLTRPRADFATGDSDVAPINALNVTDLNSPGATELRSVARY